MAQRAIYLGRGAARGHNLRQGRLGRPQKLPPHDPAEFLNRL